MKIDLNRSELVYSGRIDQHDPKEPVMIYPASSLHFRFWGKSASLQIRNRHAYWENSMGAVIDGEQKRYVLNDEGSTWLNLVDDVFESEHDILIYKRMDSCHEAVLEKLELSDGAHVLPAPERPARRIEVYGDSVSAGEVSEAVEYVGKQDPEHNGEYSNSWYSYAWMTARKLGAEIHDIAQGGIALLDGTGWFNEPDYIGMETVWNKLHYNPVFGEPVEWNFSGYTPHVVIVAIGQNDSHPEDYMKDDHKGAKARKWKKAYAGFLGNIRRKYPKAWIVCITTLLEHDPAWDHAIDDVCREMDDDRIAHFTFRRNGKGTPGHLRIPEAEEMAEELSAYIESLGVDWD